VVNPDNPEQQKLALFPSEKIIAQGDALVKKVEKESAAMRDAAVEMNRHELLVPGCLPNPNNVQAYQFRNVYRQAMPFQATPGQGGSMPIPSGNGHRNPTTQSAFAVALKAGMPPTAEEITFKQQELTDKIRRENTLMNGSGQAINQQQVDQMVQEQTAALPKQLMEDIAKTSRVYISPDTFEVNPQIAGAAGAPDALTIYLAQLGFWIQQDVVNAVNFANGNSKSVPESAVKHLISIRVDAQGIPTFIVPAGATAANDDPDAELKKDTTVSPTGRICNGLYDVFHFTVRADVQADKLDDFLRALSYRRFITPLSVDVKAVDNAAALAQGHVYGDKPVVSVTARCEILYLRKWNAPYMPALVKQKLGITTDQTGAGGAAAMPAADVQPPSTSAPSFMGPP
jgi:hypothetical protein